jgi:hypothetical protein
MTVIRTRLTAALNRGLEVVCGATLMATPQQNSRTTSVLRCGIGNRDVDFLVAVLLFNRKFRLTAPGERRFLFRLVHRLTAHYRAQDLGPKFFELEGCPYRTMRSANMAGANAIRFSRRIQRAGNDD